MTEIEEKIMLQGFLDISERYRFFFSKARISIRMPIASFAR